jgi:hypothetical protein
MAAVFNSIAPIISAFSLSQHAEHKVGPLPSDAIHWVWTMSDGLLQKLQSRPTIMLIIHLLKLGRGRRHASF